MNNLKQFTCKTKNYFKHTNKKKGKLSGKSNWLNWN